MLKTTKTDDSTKSSLYNIWTVFQCHKTSLNVFSKHCVFYRPDNKKVKIASFHSVKHTIFLFAFCLC